MSIAEGGLLTHSGVDDLSDAIDKFPVTIVHVYSAILADRLDHCCDDIIRAVKSFWREALKTPVGGTNGCFCFLRHVFLLGYFHDMRVKANKSTDFGPFMTCPHDNPARLGILQRARIASTRFKAQ